MNNEKELNFITSAALGSISPSFYKQLLHAQIPKVQKKIDNLTVFFVLSGSASVKAAHRALMKLTPREYIGLYSF